MAQFPTPWAVKDPNTNEVFEPKPTVANTTKLGVQSAAAGACVAAVQNALGTHTSGAAGVFTRYGSTIGFFAAMGATFAAAEAITANQREKDDALNGMAGGCAAGFLAGIRARSLPVAVGSCAVLGGAVGLFDYAGKTLGGGGGENLSKEERRKRFFKQQPATADE